MRAVVWALMLVGMFWVGLAVWQFHEGSANVSLMIDRWLYGMFFLHSAAVLRGKVRSRAARRARREGRAVPAPGPRGGTHARSTV